MAQALNSLANTAHYQGDVAGARPLYEESLRLRRHVGNLYGIGVSLNSLALLSGLTGDLDAARRLGEEALGLRWDLGDRRGIGGSLLCLGRLASWGRDLERAEHLARESLVIGSELDNRLGIACCLELLAEVAFQQAQQARAARLLGAAAAERTSIGAPRPPLERDEHERMMATLRDHLGDSGVEAAWREAVPAAVVAEELVAAPRHPPATSRARGGSRRPGAQPETTPPKPSLQER
jgi:tetratricopeptide repeat protein